MGTESARTIVCGTDFTGPARQAVDVAAGLASALKLRLEVAHVLVAAAGPTPSIFRVGGTAERLAQAACVPVLPVFIVRPPGDA